MARGARSRVVSEGSCGECPWGVHKGSDGGDTLGIRWGCVHEVSKGYFVGWVMWEVSMRSVPLGVV